MKFNNYLFIDSETGGTDPGKNSLLSLGLVVAQGSSQIAQTEILVSHDSYVVNAKALEVNRIDLVVHNKHALEPMKAWEAMQGFLASYFEPNERIILVGHNIAFDRAFLATFLKSIGQSFESRFSHRSIDTHSIAAALQDAGKIPVSVSLNSTGLFEHFKIEVPPEKRHTALGDALATFELYWRMVELAR
jgi:DNA polymerase III epsilon subunit-like protein